MGVVSVLLLEGIKAGGESLNHLFNRSDIVLDFILP